MILISIIKKAVSLFSPEWYHTGTMATLFCDLKPSFIASYAFWLCEKSVRI